jgi:hypothetical protein
MTSLVNAIQSLYPNTVWEITNEDYDQLIWKDETVAKPSLDELEAEKARLTIIWNNTKYQRDRKYEYPPIQDLADAIFHQANGDSAPMEAYLAAVQAVKDKFPKL